MGYNQQYKKYKDIAPADLREMSSKELSKALSALTKEVNRRGAQWAKQKHVPFVPGTKGIVDRMVKTDKGREFKKYKSSTVTKKADKIREIKKLQQITHRKTSTVTGYKQANRQRTKAIEERIASAVGTSAGGIKLTPAQLRKFGKLLKRLEEEHYIRSKAVGDYYSKGSPEIFKIAYEEVLVNKKLSIDEIFELIQDRIDKEKERKQEEKDIIDNILKSL